MIIKAKEVNYNPEPYIMSQYEEDQLEEEANLEYHYETQHEALEDRGLKFSDFI